MPFPEFDSKGMEYRFLGDTGLLVSAIGFGSWYTVGGQVKDNSVIEKCMEEAWNCGINFFDTSESYAEGQAEVEIGNALKKFGWPRKDFVISTKIFEGGHGPNDIGLCRKKVMESIERSLKNLQLDYVDIVYAHRPDYCTPMREVVRAFSDLVTQGKANYWGTSEWSAFEISEALAAAREQHLVAPVVEQPQYSIISRYRFEKEYALLFHKYKYGSTVWSPLASGLLTGKLLNGIPKDSRLASDTGFNEDRSVMNMYHGILASETGKKYLESVRGLMEIADSLGCTCAQLALAWILKNDNVSSVLTGASRPSQITENVKAVQVAHRVTPEIMEQIDKLFQNKPTRTLDLFGRWMGGASKKTEMTLDPW
ncbi:putative voltage-gated potassium channel subunit beta [Aspergillus cavernicola]|uniref:Voltage-gated potassium channel subunit beta n=1 Tax=Aspergillus cavernicola TaxID=176166 RepID=A0ABR4HIU0_9EURO